MRKALAVWGAIASFLFAQSARLEAEIHDPAYHNLEEVNARIFFLEDSLRNAGRNWMRVDSIGYSQHDHLPIYCVKLAAPDVDDTTTSKPAVVYIGQVHAEEVLGVEYCLWLIDRWISRDGVNWRQRVDTYIIPTVNPEGLTVVYSLDNTYRKNKHDIIGDDRFRYKIGWGQDTSGVDINRNFPLFWSKGSTFLMRGDNEFYDYFRGLGPLSEPEAQAIDRLFDRVRPLYSMILHSSRTGKVAEQVIYPWGFAKETKMAPDQWALDDWALQIANRCKKYGAPDKPYEQFRVANPQGDSETYLYWKYGTFACRVEIGAEGEAMQPDSIGIYAVIDQVHTGLEYLLNSAAAIATDSYGGIGRSRLPIKVVDAVTGNPLEAKLVLPTISGPMVPFRKTNPRNGRFYWPILPGFRDTLKISCFGYSPLWRVVSGDLNPTNLQPFRMQPLTPRRVGIALNDGSLSVTSNVEMSVVHPDSSWDLTIAGGSTVIVLPEGAYTLTFVGGMDFVPRRVSVNVSSDTTFNISLSPALPLFYQDFDGSDISFSSDNTMNNIPNHGGIDSLNRWDLIEVVYHSFPRSLTDTRYANTYRIDDAWVAPYNQHDRSFDLSNSGTASLTYWLNQALEPGYDSMWVEVSNGGSGDPSSWSWRQIAPAHQELSVIYSIPELPWNAAPIRIQKYGAWRRFVVPLDSFCGDPVFHFRFHLKSDTSIEEDGVYIDDVVLLASGQAPPAVSAILPTPYKFALGSPYPNPFNGQSRVEIALPKAGNVKLALYDITGRMAVNVMEGELSVGRHMIAMDAQALPAGLYLLRAVSPDGVAVVKKMTLVK